MEFCATSMLSSFNLLFATNDVSLIKPSTQNTGLVPERPVKENKEKKEKKEKKHKKGSHVRM